MKEAEKGGNSAVTCLVLSCLPYSFTIYDTKDTVKQREIKLKIKKKKEEKCREICRLLIVEVDYNIRPEFICSTPVCGGWWMASIYAFAHIYGIAKHNHRQRISHGNRNLFKSSMV